MSASTTKLSGAETVAVGIVTYGDRAPMCVRVIQGALDCGATTVIVVDNGASTKSRKVLEEVARREPRVLLQPAKTNRGSALGFAEAISLCVRSGTFTWLLDDDNVPRRDALAMIYREYASQSWPCGAVLFSNRVTDPLHRRISDGIDSYPVPGSFLSFDLIQRSRAWVPSRRLSTSDGTVAIPYGPYGGLFTRSTTFAGDRPDPEFYLYEDDTEFSLRLAERGVLLGLCKESLIDDIDGKWSEGHGTRGPARLLLAGDQRRMEFSVRNRVFIDRKRAMNGGVRYQINRSIFLVIAAVSALRHRRVKALVRLWSAVRAGESRALDRIGVTRDDGN